ncbi:MAG TPA: phage portal protein [Phycisphaerae bacterium]|nr:phage portal protein [Phycisphaerae bacterium]
MELLFKTLKANGWEVKVHQANRGAEDSSTTYYVKPSGEFTKALGDGWLMLGSPAIGTIGGRSVPSDVGLLAEFLTNGDVYTCCNYNAHAVAKQRWRLFCQAKSTTTKAYKTKKIGVQTKKYLKSRPTLAEHLESSEDIEEVLEHPLLDLLEKDNVGMNGYQLRYATQMYMEVFSGAYWQIIKGALGLPAEIKVLPTQQLHPLRKSNMQVVGYLFIPLLPQTTVQVHLDAHEVIDFRFPDVTDPYGGRQSPLRSAFMDSTLSGKYIAHQNYLLDNRARIDGIFIPKEEFIDKNDAERTENNWNQKFKGSGNGRVLVAKKPGTFAPTQYSPADLNELQIRQESFRRLCNAYGIGEALVSKDATFANMAGAIHLHAVNTILPRLLILEQSLNQELVAMYGSGLFLAFENPIPADENNKLQRTQVGVAAKVLTDNEIRVSLGFDKRDDALADELPANRQADAEQITQSGAPTDNSATPGSKSNEAGANIKPPETTPQMTPTNKSAREAEFLLKLNAQVTRGRIERAAAITLAARFLCEPEEICKSLVSHGITKGTGDRLQGIDGGGAAT